MDLEGSPSPDPLGFFTRLQKTDTPSLSKGDALMEKFQAPMGNLYFSFCRLVVSLTVFSGSFQRVDGWKEDSNATEAPSGSALKQAAGRSGL